jgi:hypothetical protein
MVDSQNVHVVFKECDHFCKMPKRVKRAKVNDDAIILVDNPMKAKHAKPPVDEHGLCLANPCRVLVCGGCGASKTTTVLNAISRGAMWKPWEHIYLMAPTEDVQQGEYGLVDTTFLKELPQLEYFKQRPGRSCLIMDDIHLHSHSTAKKDGAASQAELLERICGHMSTHHDGGLSVFICHQVWTGIPPKVRKLASHMILFPQRIAKDSVGHIARGCMMTKRQLETCFDMCQGPYDFLLITNEPDGRARVRINGVDAVPGIN